MILNNVDKIYVGSTPVERVYVGSTLYHGIPKGYTRLKYLEFTGTQYIDTNIRIPHNYIDVIIDANISSESDDRSAILGSTANDTHPTTGILFAIRTDFPWLMYAYGSYGTYNQQGLYHPDERTLLTLKGTSSSYIVSWGDDSLDGYDSKGYSETANYYFRIGRLLETKYIRGKYYSITVNGNNETPIMNLIPCLDKAYKPCMYDTVSGQTFYNQGTGEFKYDIYDIIPSTYTQLEYLESDGNQWLDTGWVAPVDGDGVRINSHVQLIEPIITNGSVLSIKIIGSVSDTGLGIYGAGISLSSGNNNNAIAYRIEGYYASTVGVSNVILLDTVSYSLGDTLKSEYVADPSSMTTSLYINDIYVDSTNYYATNITPASLSLFNSSIFFKDNIISTKTNGRVYGVYATDFAKTKMLFNGIPCLDSNGRPCLYDTISKTTSYNSGTGEFNYILYADIPSTYTRLDYLESNGNATIDTGVNYPQNVTIDGIVSFEKELTTGPLAYGLVGGLDTIGYYDCTLNIGCANETTYFVFNGIATYNIQLGTFLYDYNGEDNYNISDIIQYHKKYRYLEKGLSTTTETNTARISVGIYDSDNNKFYTGGWNNVRSYFQERSVTLFPTITKWQLSKYFTSPHGKIYSLKVIDNETTKEVIFLVPCLDADGVPCFYNVANKQTLYNNGTGSFGYTLPDGTVVDPI